MCVWGGGAHKRFLPAVSEVSKKFNKSHGRKSPPEFSDESRKPLNENTGESHNVPNKQVKKAAWASKAGEANWAGDTDWDELEVLGWANQAKLSEQVRRARLSKQVR